MHVSYTIWEIYLRKSKKKKRTIACYQTQINALPAGEYIVWHGCI